MPPKISNEKKEMVLKIYEYFKRENDRKRPFFSWNKFAERTADATGVSKKTLLRLLKEENENVSEPKQEIMKLS